MSDRTRTDTPHPRPTLVGRREFTVTSALALLSGVTITLGACSSDSSPSTPTPTPTNQDRFGVVSAPNHGHSAPITSAQLTAGGAISLNIQGAADHPHTAEVTSGDLNQIAAGQRVVKNSSTNGNAADGAHSHTVTFN